MTTDILYSFRRCPYAIRARWALLICEIKVEIREVDLKDKPLDFLKKSSTKTVPILLKKNNEVIEESLDIIIWALSESEKEHLKNFYFPNAKEEEILEIISENDNGFKYHLDRFKYSTRFNASDEKYHFLEAMKFIKKWEIKLSDSKWLIGDNPSIADWCIWPFIRQFKIACESQKKTNYFGDSIKEWLRNFEKHHLYKKLMHKYAKWAPSNKKSYFPFN
tara:strand:- start:157 stop:816 length:660 start_codon:yes stop_codon:yes gene_type:complete